jgi:hypothetical protein
MGSLVRYCPLLGPNIVGPDDKRFIAKGAAAGSNHTPATLVERIAMIISITKGIAINRVRKPHTRSRPPTISRIATKWAIGPGAGMPIFVKRPTPWFTYMNFRIPSDRNTLQPFGGSKSLRTVRIPAISKANQSFFLTSRCFSYSECYNRQAGRFIPDVTSRLLCGT